MVKSRALGRGLDALIPTFQTEDRSGHELPVNEISIQDIKPNPYQPRRDFAAEELEELAQSIREKGLISPVTVTERNGEYVLVAGERRLRACKQLGMDTIPSYFRPVDGEEELMELALIENVQRENLNPIEEAMAYRALIERYGLSQEVVAERIGKKRSTITNSMRLLKLPEEIRESLIAEEISSGHARAILAAGETSRMVRVWQQIVKKGLSVREAEKLTQKPGGDASGGNAPAKSLRKDTHVLKLESTLQKSLGTKVRIR
ncbi:MAG: ParB/RepB/Spo0J family partition protein, partial [Thermovirgaceae bacterium]|nr:ParB/RepB/Spo0J family partition protein [Thermovirgaceae bacterium]